MTAGPVAADERPRAAGRWTGTLCLVVAAATAVSVAAVVARHRDDPLTAVALGTLVVLLGAGSVVDVREQRIPNRITHSLALVVTLAAVGIAVADGAPSAALAPIGAGLGLALTFLVLRFGMGDVKLGYSVAAVAALLDAPALVVTLLGVFVSGGLASVLVLAVNRRRGVAVSYGPFLALGSVLGMLVA